jgi:hypothetical protein
MRIRVSPAPFENAARTASVAMSRSRGVSVNGSIAVPFSRSSTRRTFLASKHGSSDLDPTADPVADLLARRVSGCWNAACSTSGNASLTMGRRSDLAGTTRPPQRGRRASVRHARRASGSISPPAARRPRSSAASRMVPVPANGSTTRSPGRRVERDEPPNDLRRALVRMAAMAARDQACARSGACARAAWEELMPRGPRLVARPGLPYTWNSSISRTRNACRAEPGRGLGGKCRGESTSGCHQSLVSRRSPRLSTISRCTAVMAMSQPA